jgi:two-component system OmpR family sensor kinase
MSLRTRLIAGLLALATVGLLLLAGVTYAEQRHFLMSRVDDQAKQASQWSRGGGGLLPFGGANPGYGSDDDDNGGGPPAARGGPGPAAGTYIWTRDTDGTATTPDCNCYDTSVTPTWPTSLTAGGPVTIKATNTGKSYRVYGTKLRDGTIKFAAVPLEETTDTLNRLLRISGLVIVGILLALGALSWWLVRIGLRPLERIGVTAGAIAGGDLSRRVEPATQKTEVGRLGLALNRMLDRLEDAFSKQKASEDRLRAFIADASHELRTPLASIRGYAELFRIGAARDEEGTEKAMNRIEAEAARMGVLVEDLLTLARLDEVREQIREDVDLGRLAGDAVDDARATAPDRDIELEHVGLGHVSGDPHQLRQVFANLLRNALVHTPAGTPIEVSVRDEDRCTVLEVRDYGPGLPTDENDALFERFWRAEAGRKQGKAGAGLGLAIVAGIVAAHEGSVSAANAPGGGARFTVRLPSGGDRRTPPAAATEPEATAAT